MARAACCRRAAAVQAATAEYHDYSIAIRRAERIASIAGRHKIRGPRLFDVECDTGENMSKRRRVRNLVARAFDDVLDQREAAGDGQQENLFDDAGAPLDAIVNLIRLDSFCGHNRADVLHKINATLLAGAAFALFVLASRAFVTQRSVATRAKSRDVASIRPTFKTFDRALRSRARSCGRFNSAGRGRPACFGRRVARFTGRESPTHAHILDLQPRPQCSAERKRGFAVNTGPAYSRRNSAFSPDCICNRCRRKSPAAARANAFAATACLREIDRFSGRKGT